MSDIVVGLLAVIIGHVVAIGIPTWWIFRHLGREKAEAEEKKFQREKHLIQQKKDRRTNLGNRAFRALSQVVTNRTMNQNLRVQNLTENGDNHSVLIGWEEHSSFTQGGVGYLWYPVMQINVGIEKDNFSIGPYPDPKNGTYLETDDLSDQNMDGLIAQACRYVEGYSPSAPGRFIRS